MLAGHVGSRQRAVTLIELMVGLAVIGVLLTLVGPSFKRMIEMQRVRSINAQLVTDLQLARAEASSRNKFARVTFREDASVTCYSIYTFKLTSAMCDCRVTPACVGSNVAEIKTVRLAVADGVTVKSQSGTFDFLFDPITGGLYQTSLDGDLSTLSMFAARVQIDAQRAIDTTIGISGRVTVCKPTGSQVTEVAC